MHSKRYNIFTSFGFLASLLLLLLNDFFLKSYFHNWLTGKLSDFSGLFVFALFLAAFLTKRKWIAFVFTAIFFVFWKSPYSTPLIEFWNSLNLFNIYRVIDYTDLIALSILFPAYSYQKKYYKSVVKTVFKYGIACVCVFSFMATTLEDDGSFIPSINLDEQYLLPLDIGTVRDRLVELDNIVYTERSTNEDNQTFAFIFIETETCIGSFEYDVSFIENEEGTTDFFLSSVFLSCQGTAFTPEELIAFFEEQVIDRI